MASALARDSQRVHQVIPHGRQIYIDTLGLADSRRRQEAAIAIAGALREGDLYSVIFVITLEAWHVRPEDKVTMELVLGSLQKANISNKYGVIVNKVPAKDYDEATEEKLKQFKEDLFLGLTPTDHVCFLTEVPEIVDKARVVLPLANEFLSFMDNLCKVEIKSSDVADIKWNKFEELRKSLTAEMQALDDRNRELS